MNSSTDKGIVLDHEEQVLREILAKAEDLEHLDLQTVMKALRARCGRFTATEALLHMMEALIFEATRRRGW
jgi:hypothetical protein